MATLIKKHLTRPFLNDGTSQNPSWVQIKKAVEFTRSMNPTTEERDYIADEMPTTEVTQYKPSESFSITAYKGEPDFDLFYSLYKARAIGDDAKREFLLVSLFDKVTVSTTDYYYAEKCGATITVNEFNFSDSSITIDINENGTPAIGYVTITDGVPSFTEGDMPTPSPKVATPTASPEAGSYSETKSVTLSCATSGATIYYTVDGSTPTSASTEYASPISVSETTTIKAIAVKANMTDSDVLTAAYTITD